MNLLKRLIEIEDKAILEGLTEDCKTLQMIRKLINDVAKGKGSHDFG